MERYLLKRNDNPVTSPDMENFLYFLLTVISSDFEKEEYIVNSWAIVALQDRLTPSIISFLDFSSTLRTKFDEQN